MNRTPTLGTIVHYMLSESDATKINRRRTDGTSIRDRIPLGRWPLGAQAHIGETVHAGNKVAAVVVAVAKNGKTSINLQCLLDGSDVFYVKSAEHGNIEGTWCWPE